METAQEFMEWFTDNLGSTDMMLQKKLDALPLGEIKKLRGAMDFVSGYMNHTIKPPRMY